jgi:hypothetical protein
MLTRWEMYRTPATNLNSDSIDKNLKSGTDGEVYDSAGVVLQLSSRYVEDVFRFHHFVDRHVGHSVDFQLHGHFLADKSR